MIRSFSHKNIADWSLFSGDSNIIHYDKNIAKENGLKDIVVQGMLVMLDAKLLITPYLQESSSLTFSIKKPIYVDLDMIYEIKTVKDKKFLTVSEIGQDKPCITASLLQQSMPVLEKPCSTIRFKSSDFLEKMTLFKRLYPEVIPQWLMMDTLIFAISFSQQKDEFFQKKAQGISCQHDNNKIITYQVDQKILVSKKLANSYCLDIKELEFSFEERDVMKNENSAYSVLEVQVFYENSVIYQSSLGCMTKVYMP